MLCSKSRGKRVGVCSRVLCDGVSYDDGSVPVGNLGVIVELRIANGLLTGLERLLVTSSTQSHEDAYTAGDLLELVCGKR